MGGYDDDDYQYLPSDDQQRSKAAKPSSKGCRDPAFAALFVGTAGLIVYLAAIGGKEVLNRPTDDDETNDDELADVVGSTSTGKVAGMVCGVAAFAGLFCVLWISLIIRYAKSILTCSYYTYAAIYSLCAVAAFSAGQTFFGVVCIICLVLLWCAWRGIRQRIPFAAANLTTACTALNKHKAIISVVVIMIILSLAWCFAVILAIAGLYAQYKDRMSGLVWFGLLVAYFWGGLICANVCHVTIAGTVGSWWFTPPSDATSGASHAVFSSYQRAMTTSFGSISFGSLLVAVLEALKSMAKEAQRRGGACACCAVCILNCIENFAQYINRYAFVYVGLYGDDFCTAGSHVFSLFSKRGWFDTILNDWTIDNALHLGMLVVGVLTGCAGAVIGVLVDKENSRLIWFMAIFGFITGYMLACIVRNTISSAVATVYVAFAESHEALQANHPATFYNLYDTWMKFHPRMVTYIVVSEAEYQAQTAPSAVVVDAVPAGY